MIPLPHYAESFFTEKGRCFRLVQDDDRVGQPTHCPNPVEWRGNFLPVNQTGRGYTVDSCDGHMHDLTKAQPI